MPTLCLVVDETGNWDRILEMCKFQFSLEHCRMITSVNRYSFSPNLACSSEMWSVLHLVFWRQQTRSRYPILEVADSDFGSSSKSTQNLKLSNSDFVLSDYSVERYHSQFVTDSLPNFACISEMWLLRRLLFLRQARCRYAILKVCEFQFWRFLESGHHVLQWIGTKFCTW